MNLIFQYEYTYLTFQAANVLLLAFYTYFVQNYIYKVGTYKYYRDDLKVVTFALNNNFCVASKVL